MTGNVVLRSVIKVVAHAVHNFCAGKAVTTHVNAAGPTIPILGVGPPCLAPCSLRSLMGVSYFTPIRSTEHHDMLCYDSRHL